MESSSLEITEKEYLLKLRRKDFDLSFIYQLLKRIQSEQLFYAKKQDGNEDDILSRYLNSGNQLGFDQLDDK
jgi:hypothetical protein